MKAAAVDAVPVAVAVNVGLLYHAPQTLPTTTGVPAWEARF